MLVRVRTALKTRQTGLTLIELLVAMTLMALIMTMLFGGLNLGARSWEATNAKISQVEERRLISGFMRRTFERMRIVRRAVAGNRERLLFSGRDDAIEFVASMPPGVGLRGVYLVRFFVQPAQQLQELVIQYWLLHPDVLEGNADVPPWKPLEEDVSLSVSPPAEVDAVASHLYGERILLGGIEEAVFSYADIDDSDLDEWEERWDISDKPPGLVKVSFTFPAQKWPDLTVSVLGERASGRNQHRGTSGGFLPF